MKLNNNSFTLFLFFSIYLFPNMAFSQESSPGIQSRFSFGTGAQLGFGDQATAGIVGSIRFMGVAGVDLEYDFNRVTSSPESSPKTITDLLFVPALKLGGIVYFFRSNRYAPFGMGGIGIDLDSATNRTNLYWGGGIEFTFVKNRITANIGLRFFLPRPVDVEKQRERLTMDGKATLPSYTEYYNLNTYQFFFSVRIYY